MRRREGKRLTAYYAVTLGLDRRGFVKRCGAAEPVISWGRFECQPRKEDRDQGIVWVGWFLGELTTLFLLNRLCSCGWLRTVNWKGCGRNMLWLFFFLGTGTIYSSGGWVKWQESDKDNTSDPRSCTEWSPLDYRSARATQSLLWNLFRAWWI